MISGLTLHGFLTSCKDQNVRFMETVDPRLLQPRVIPAVGDLLELLTRFLPGTRGAAQPLGAQ
jgi:hypothetical protein